jgi:hypothetical protein
VALVDDASLTLRGNFRPITLPVPEKWWPDDSYCPPSAPI